MKAVTVLTSRLHQPRYRHKMINQFHTEHDRDDEGDIKCMYSIKGPFPHVMISYNPAAVFPKQPGNVGAHFKKEL